jgi:hypothetical protein
MRPFASFKLYPRPDKEYLSKSSLDYQRVLGNLYNKRPTEGLIQLNLWALCFLVGLSMGILAFFLDIIVEEIIEWRWKMTE